MSLKGIRKALNEYPDMQEASIWAANHGEMPVRTRRHPKKIIAIYWLGTDGKRWYGFEVKDLKLSFAAYDKKPRGGLILDDKPHQVLVDGHWQRWKHGTVLYYSKQDDRWYYSAEQIVQLFAKVWALKCTTDHLKKVRDIYYERQNDGEGLKS